MTEPRDDELDKRPPVEGEPSWSGRDLEAPGGWPRTEEEEPDWPRPPGEWGAEPSGWGAEAAAWQPDDPWRRDEEPPAWEPEPVWPDEPWPERRPWEPEAPAWQSEPSVGWEAEPSPAWLEPATRHHEAPRTEDAGQPVEAPAAISEPVSVVEHPPRAEPAPPPSSTEQPILPAADLAAERRRQGERDREAARQRELEREREAAERRSREVAAQRERDAAERREREAAAEREREAAAEREREAAARRERQAAAERDREAAAQRDREAAAQRDREAAAQGDREAAAIPPPASREPEPPPPIVPPFPEVAAAERRGDAVTAAEAPIQTRVATPGWQEELAPRRATLAEQAVPWLIGVILLLAGMVIVLLALIFSSEGGFLGVAGRASGDPSRSPSIGAAGLGAPGASPTASGGVAGPVASAAATPNAVASADPTPTPTPGPTYGALEMIYLARASAQDPIWLYRVDFTTTDAAAVTAQASEGIERYAWAPDGTRGAVLVTGRVIAVTSVDEPTRLLAEAISAFTFGRDAETVYGARITTDGDSQTAEVVAIGYADAATRSLGTVTYPAPAATDRDPVRAAQFADEGGDVRLMWNADGRLVLRVEGAPVTVFDPSGAEPREIGSVPTLHSPDGTRYVGIADDGTTTTLTLRAVEGGARMRATSAAGLVSHLRWAPNGSQVVFTLTRSDGLAGVFQDLYLWNLDDGGPIQLTANGASFGAAFLGSPEVWRR